MTTKRGPLSAADIADRCPASFRHVHHQLHARFRTKDFVTALDLCNRIAQRAEESNHHPDLDLRWGRLDVRLSSHDVGGITDRDIALARQITDIAAEVDARPETDALQQIELGLDTWARAEVKAFWQALLGYADGGDEIADPHGAGPTIWFQQTDQHSTPRQRLHLDVWVPTDQAEARVRAALAAGGTLVDDGPAPSFWVLADSQGNRACVCTVEDRGTT